MNNLNFVPSFIQIIGIAVTLFIATIAGMWGFSKWRSTRQDKEDDKIAKLITSVAVITSQVIDIKAQQDKQFGGNGGGIREAVNTIRETQITEAVKTDKNTAAIATLAGAFAEHTRVVKK